MELSLEQIGNLLNLGWRPIEAPDKYIKGDLVAAYSLAPTKKIWDELKPHAFTEAGAGWEGSYVPLLIYKSGVAAILVGHDELAKDPYWTALTEKLSVALNMTVIGRGD